MKPRNFWISLTTAVVLGVLSMATQARDLKVNCDVGQSLQDAINRARSSAAPLVLKVKGDCYEDVILSRDLVTIDGGGEAVIHGSLINRGARVTVSNIGITRPGFGMRATTGRTRLINVHFFDNAEEGLIVRRNGVVIFPDGSVTDNDLEGVVVESATLIVGDVEISGNYVGIDATMSRITLNDTQVVENDGVGLRGFMHTSVIINGSAAIERNGENGVRLELDSGLFTRDAVRIKNNGWTDVYCQDSESSAQFDGFYPGSVACTDFNW